MTRTYICDHCARVAVVIEDDDTLLCGECFLQQTVRKFRPQKARREKSEGASAAA